MHSISARLPHDSKHSAASANLPGQVSARGKKGASGDLHDVYFRLRQAIITGAIAPREILNQVHIAQEFGVSRTPVREALRMLQAENLVETQYQHRVRVTQITPQEIDGVYATWLLVQSLGTALTVPLITPDELSRIRAALEKMNAHTPSEAGDHSEWEGEHSGFHQLLVMHAGPVILESIDSCWSRSERARRAYIRTAPRSWMESEGEHNELVEAYADRDIPRVVYFASRQLARIARIVISSIDPAYEPTAIRSALTMISASNPEPPAKSKK